MFENILLFYNLTLFKKTPQDIPYSKTLTYLALIAYAVIDFLMQFMSDDWLSALLEMTIDVLMLMIFTRFTLLWVNKTGRYLQTFCALLGMNALLTLWAIPPTAVMLIPSGDLAWVGFFVVIGLTLWHWAIMGHILHHALDQTLGFSLGLALLYVMANYYLLVILFPPVSATG